MKNNIRKIFYPGSYPAQVHLVLLILRIAVGVLMLTHGTGKLEVLLGNEPIQFSDPLGVGATASLTLAVFSEVFCAFLLILGVGTRLSALPLIVTMLVAAFIVHINDDFGRQELPLLYFLIFLTIVVVGPGKYSFDYLLFKKIKQ